MDWRQLLKSLAFGLNAGMTIEKQGNVDFLPPCVYMKAKAAIFGGHEGRALCFWRVPRVSDKPRHATVAKPENREYLSC